MFRVPDEDDDDFLPSTPIRRSLRDIPSTTPAEPPPSSRKKLPSFTPKGPPPPSSAFGSSQLRTGGSKNPLFSVRNGNSNKSSLLGRKPLGSSPPRMGGTFTADYDVDMDEEEESATVPTVEDSMMVDDSMAQISPGFDFLKSMRGSTQVASPRGNKRTRAGEIVRQQLPRRVEGMDIQGHAKAAVKEAPAPELEDPDEVILETERVVEPLSAAVAARAEPEDLMTLSADINKTWQKYGKLSQPDVIGEHIGPESNDNGIAKANLVASLMMALHLPQGAEGQVTTVPRVLLDWLDRVHDPSFEAIQEVLNDKPGSYYRWPAFWDSIYISINRGRFANVLKLLKGAGFEQNVEQDINDQQAEGIEFAVTEAIDLIMQCPALVSQNWDMKGPDWLLFRHRVEKASERLKEYAEDGSSAGRSLFESLRGGDSLNRSALSRRIDSVVPFEIYEPLQEMYTLLMGDPVDIMKGCFDWLEGAIVLTAWWDGNEDVAGKASLAASKRSRPQQRAREVDINTLQAYRNQIAWAFNRAMSEEDVRVGFLRDNSVHLAIGCVLLGDIEYAIELMKSWSMPIATAMMEVASAGGWISGSGARGTIENFDKSDLMVLSYGQGDEENKKDAILELYAELLAEKGTVSMPGNGLSMEGWELALRILSRLDDLEQAQTMVAELLDGVSFEDNEQVDSLLQLCNELGFGTYAMTLTEKYADSLADKTHRYGDALVYYLRAHNFPKAKKIIDALITSSLVQSTAYPPKDKLDQKMREFIENPKEHLNMLASMDFEAAQKLASWLSGYATLRKFYNLRDEVSDNEAGRNRAAATALLSVITSANDPIRGGLFDPSTEIIVPIDALLALLSEALPLLKQSPCAFKPPQLFALLKAVEDLQTIGPRIYAQCETLFQTALSNAYGADVPSPRAMLRKETSGMTGSSAFSLVGSSLLNSKDSIMASKESEEDMVLVGSGEVERGWDWRKGMQRKSTGEDVLRIVRLVVAERVADAWAEGEE